ncbi:MAG: sigma-54 dependent transcriptional regulator [Gammaproteobacteria bacterium]
MSARPHVLSKPAVLLVDDDPAIRDSLGFYLGRRFTVVSASSRQEVQTLLANTGRMPRLALVDLGLPPDTHSPEEGFALIPELLAHDSEMRILVLTGQEEAEHVNHALALGAADFISKPSAPEHILARLEHQQLMLETQTQDQLQPGQGEMLLGESPAMDALRAQIRQFASAPFPVLITGESGCGKELVAREIHRMSEGSRGPYVAVNCAALPGDLIEAQLFGHARGAFTGAHEERVGFFAEASGGTLLLDEMGELPPGLQAKLLRVLENGEYYRVGETRPRHAKVRLLAATNRDLRALVDEGRFRADLYHRLSVLRIHCPPLRDRAGDATRLLRHFQQAYARTVPRFILSKEAQRLWETYNFPGNVRELKNLVIRLGTKYPNQTVSEEALRAEMDPGTGQLVAPTATDAQHHLRQIGFELDGYLHEVEREHILCALDLAGGNLSKAARYLGLNRTTLYSRMQRLGVR